MANATSQKKMDELMERASEALSQTNYFEAEKFAQRALIAAWQVGDFERMTRIILPLQEARRQRVQLAFDVGFVAVMDGDPIGEDISIEPGCYLVRPPRVGADARRLRLAGLNQQVPVVVICREPTTQIRLCPIVSTLPGKSFRCKMDEPADQDAPELAWMAAAIEILGDTIIDEIDYEKPPEKRIDSLLEALEALPEHEGLHQALADTCREALQQRVADAKTPMT
jgi:hypothetical protein